jgi:hypothetical protein
MYIKSILLSKKGRESYKVINYIAKRITNRFWGFLIFSIFFILIYLIYRISLDAFFQGDEWFYFTLFLPLTHRYDGILTTLYKSIFSTGEVSGGGHVTPIYNGLWFIANWLFGLHYTPYMLTSLFMHSINSFLVYKLSLRLNLKNVIALLAGVIFAVTYVHFQAITWVMAVFPTLFSVTFMLLSLIYLLSANKGNKELYLSAIFYVLALLTKETTIILFPILPFIAYLYKREKFLYTLKLIFSISVVYLLFRFGLPIFLSKGEGNTQSIFAIGTDLLLFRSFTYPLKVLVQVFIPSEVILMLAEKMSFLSYPFIESMKATDMTTYLTLIQGTVSDIIIYFLAGVFLSIIVLVLILLKKSKQVNYFRALVVSASIILMSALPLLGIAAYAEWWGYTTFIDSRHLYIASIGASLILALLINVIYKLTNKKVLRFFALAICSLVIISWLSLQYFLLQNQLDREKRTGIMRKKIINTIQSTVPVLSKKDIFLITSDSHYYGFSNIPPFQTNLGQILAVLYYDKQQLPEEFISKGIFSDASLNENGFQNFRSRGFGFFTTEKVFLQSIKKYDLQDLNVHAFEWRGKENELISISERISKKASIFIDVVRNTNNWKMYKNDKFIYYYPDTSSNNEFFDEYALKSFQIISDYDQVNIQLFKKPAHIAFHDYVSEMKDQLNIINGFNVMNFIRSEGDEMTVVQISDHRYLIPMYDSNYYLDVSNPEQTATGKKLLEYFISTIYF